MLAAGRIKHLACIESGNVLSVGYDAQSMTLEVVFRPTPDIIYRYCPVYAQEYIGLVTAESLGAHFAKHFKNNFKPVSDPEAGKTFSKVPVSEDLKKALEPFTKKED